VGGVGETIRFEQLPRLDFANMRSHLLFAGEHLRHQGEDDVQSAIRGIRGEDEALRSHTNEPMRTRLHHALGFVKAFSAAFSRGE